MSSSTILYDPHNFRYFQWPPTPPKPKHRRKRWTKERRAILVSLAACGYKRDELAEVLGISPHAVSCEMNRLGLTIKHLNNCERMLALHY